MLYTNYNWITDRLAVGGLVAEPGELPFDAVLSMATFAPAGIGEQVRTGHVEFQWRSIADGYCYEAHDEIVRRFDSAADQLHAWIGEGKRVLVHCEAGVSRAATAATWYLVKWEGRSWDEALGQLRSRRPQVNPNVRFEIPLRMAAGDDVDEAWIERRIDQFQAFVLQQEGFEPDRQEILDDLERQGTLRRIAVH